MGGRSPEVHVSACLDACFLDRFCCVMRTLPSPPPELPLRAHRSDIFVGCGCQLGLFVLTLPSLTSDTKLRKAGAADAWLARPESAVQQLPLNSGSEDSSFACMTCRLNTVQDFGGVLQAFLTRLRLYFVGEVLQDKPPD